MFRTLLLSCELCPVFSRAKRHQLTSEFQSLDDLPACTQDIALSSAAMFFPDLGLRFNGDENGGMETRIISFETKAPKISDRYLPFSLL